VEKTHTAETTETRTAEADTNPEEAMIEVVLIDHINRETTILNKSKCGAIETKEDHKEVAEEAMKKALTKALIEEEEVAMAAADKTMTMEAPRTGPEEVEEGTLMEANNQATNHRLISDQRLQAL
jgi:hypothetical protein